MSQWVAVRMSPGEARDLARAVRILHRVIDENGVSPPRDMRRLADALEDAVPVDDGPDRELQGAASASPLDTLDPFTGRGFWRHGLG